ncbi:MAG: alpha/beta hydrolase [Clostridia bacterium]|jgi:pimeloyl-ACP methyl ester carboxylesterase|nr:alpha/beta hydrolase [Clostridia bacterium]
MKNILLIHGWDYRNYTKHGGKDAWANRSKFIDKLGEKYNVNYMNLPGFCGQPEPEEKEWKLEDYAEYIENYITENDFEPDFVLGYSFGGAVSLQWKMQYGKDTPVILTSPALLRASRNKNIRVKKWPKQLNFVRKTLRDIYLINVVKNSEMKYGTSFLRKTYQNIVRVDMSKSLLAVNPEEVKLIFGSDDHMVPPKLIEEKIGDAPVKSQITIIQDGKHDIANTHTEEVVSLIDEYVSHFEKSIKENKDESKVNELEMTEDVVVEKKDLLKDETEDVEFK